MHSIGWNNINIIPKGLRTMHLKIIYDRNHKHWEISEKKCPLIPVTLYGIWAVGVNEHNLMSMEMNHSPSSLVQKLIGKKKIMQLHTLAEGLKEKASIMEGCSDGPNTSYLSVCLTFLSCDIEAPDIKKSLLHHPVHWLSELFCLK